ncbi:SPT3 Dosage dependent suppressor of Ty-induced promoter mutations-like protein, partial [Haplosporangium sp. Z 27]
PEVYEALNNGSCLSLEASVVCQSDHSKVIQTCTGCVLRERKRAQRKKSLGKKKTAASADQAPPLDEDDPEQMSLEQRKILLFNCTEIAEFSSGELILPTRITCYCRHHGEKQGFCIQFLLRDYANNVVAVGISPPIMITDDHKASKVKKPEQTADAQQKNTSKKSTDPSNKVITLTPPSSPTSPGDEVESEVDMGTSHDDDEEEEEEESEMDSASSNASPSPLQASMDIGHFDPNNSSIVEFISQFSQADDARQVPSPSSPVSPSERVSQACQTTPSPDYPSTSFDNQQFHTMNSIIYASSNDRMVPEQLVDIPISIAASPTDHSKKEQADRQRLLHQEQERQLQQHQQQLLQQQHLQFQQLQQQALFPDTFANGAAAVTPSPIARRTSTSGGVGPVRRRRAPAAPNPLTASAPQPAATTSNSTNPLATSPSILSPTSIPTMSSILGLPSSLAMVPPGFIMPRMSRLIPNSGPCFGGIEITILGSNFYAGLTAMFDTAPALPTQFWSPNTLICILPPRIQPGTTVVTFKEHPAITLPQTGDVNEMMLFTYVDESDKALMELALQVVGLKMTGRLEDARNIALRIVGSQVANGGQGQQQQQGQQGQQHQNSLNYANLVRDLILSFGDQDANAETQIDLEDRILTLLKVLSELPATSYSVINLGRRDTGHRLLHLSAMKGYERLLGALVANPEIEVDALDMNGYSALHYACWRGEVDCVKMLVASGTDVMLRSVHGVGCVDLAGMNGQVRALELIQVLRDSNSWVDAGAQETDGYESALEVEGEDDVNQELEALDGMEDDEDSGVWLEHFATESDVLEDEFGIEDAFETSSFVGSEIEDLAWVDRGEWIGEEMSDESSIWSDNDSDNEENHNYNNATDNTENANIVQTPSSPNLIPMATPLGQDTKESQAREIVTNWVQKTLSQLQSSSPTFDFEFLKALNQILPEKSAFLMNIPSMPTSIQAFNANIGTYMPYNFSGKQEAHPNETITEHLSEKQPFRQERNASIGEPTVDVQAMERELWNLHNGSEDQACAATTTPVPEEAPSRYLSVYHEPFLATSVLQQPVNSYALPSQDSPYSPLTLTSAPLSNSPLRGVRRVYPQMGSGSELERPASTSEESAVIRGGRRIITEIVNHGAVAGSAAVAERAVEAVGENRHIQELRARYHQKMKRLKKDKMLFLFWVPVLLVMLALTVIRIASTFDIARQWTGGLIQLAGIQV